MFPGLMLLPLYLCQLCSFTLSPLVSHCCVSIPATSDIYVLLSGQLLRRDNNFLHTSSPMLNCHLLYTRSRVEAMLSCISAVKLHGSSRTQFRFAMPIHVPFTVKHLGPKYHHARLRGGLSPRIPNHSSSVALPEVNVTLLTIASFVLDDTARGLLLYYKCLSLLRRGYQPFEVGAYDRLSAWASKVGNGN